MPPVVDVLVPVYDEPLDVVEPTVAAARALRGAKAVIEEELLVGPGEDGEGEE